MKLTDTNGTQIKDGDTLELMEDMPAAAKGTHFTVESRLWDEEDTTESLVATTHPNTYMTLLLDQDRASKFRILP